MHDVRNSLKSLIAYLNGAHTQYDQPAGATCIYAASNGCTRGLPPHCDSHSGREHVFLSGWVGFSGQANFFFNFHENLAQELHQNLGPEPEPKPWSRTWSQNVVQKLHQKIGPCGFCIGAPECANFLQSYFELISAPSFGTNSISLARFLVQFLHQVFGPIPEPKIPSF